MSDPIPAEAVQAAPGEPVEIADLPVEVRALVHAVDRMRDRWAEADENVRLDLWQAVHAANDAVWGRLDGRESPQTAPESTETGREGIPRDIPRSQDEFSAPESRTALRARIQGAIDAVLDKPNGFAYRGTLADAVLAALDQPEAACSWPCDPDCDADCHQEHLPSWKRDADECGRCRALDQPADDPDREDDRR